jgi:hypothetical protein
LPYNLPESAQPENWKKTVLSIIKSYYREQRKKAGNVIKKLHKEGQEEIASKEVAYIAFEAPKCLRKNKKAGAWEKCSLTLNQAWADWVARKVSKLATAEDEEEKVQENEEEDDEEDEEETTTQKKGKNVAKKGKNGKKSAK